MATWWNTWKFRLARIPKISLAYLVRFLMYNFVGALLPLAIAWSIRQVSDINSPTGVYASEILFFGIMISATALGDITDETKLVNNNSLFQLIKGALLFGAIGVAAFFGVYQYDSIINPVNSAFRQNITGLACILAVFLFATSMLAEILIARNKSATTP